MVTGSPTDFLIQFLSKEVYFIGNDNNSSIAKILGSNIKRIRTLEGISQEKLAEQIGKSSHFISLVERGECGLSISTVIDICNALNTDTNSIFAGVVGGASIYTDSFLNKSFENFNTKDKDLITYIVNYILSSKT